MKKVRTKVTKVGNMVRIKFEDSGKVLLIDRDTYYKYGDLIRINKYWNDKYYARVKSTFLHRLIINVDDPKLYIDHINGNSLDNRRKNLRVCTNAENQWNCGKKSTSKQKYKGVRQTRYGTYEARIRYGGKRHHLGTFKTIEEAVKVYNEKALEVHGEFAYVNVL